MRCVVSVWMSALTTQDLTHVDLFCPPACLVALEFAERHRNVTLEENPSVGWAGVQTGWANGAGGSPDGLQVSEGLTRGERRGLDGEWLGLPSNKAYYADGWTAGAPDKYWYSTCSHANECDGENRPQNVAEHTEEYDDGWDKSLEPVPSASDWMRFGHAAYTGSVLSKHGEEWESYPYGDVDAYMDSYTGPLNEADLDSEISNGGGRRGGWANRERERDGGWWDGENEAKEREADGNRRYEYFWKKEANVMGYPEAELPGRSTNSLDVSASTGDRYQRFWGADAISRDVRQQSDFFRPENDGVSPGSSDKASMESWYSHGEGVPRDNSYKSLWRDDIQLGGQMAGVADGDIYGGSGLVYTYRNRYDDENAFELPLWQQKGQLSRAKREAQGMASYPWALYNYGVDETEHDLRQTERE